MECSEATENHTEDKYDNILNFLVQNRLLQEFRSFTTYEKQGLEYSEKLKEFFDDQLLLFTNKFSFYLKSTNFKETQVSSNLNFSFLRARITNRLIRLVVSFISNLPVYMKKRKTIKNKKTTEEQIKSLLEEWSNRLNNNPFHGGDTPDDADMNVFSVLRMYRNANKIDLLISKNSDIKVSDWESKMKLLCTRYLGVKTNDFAYTINNLDKDNVYKDQKINKTSQYDVNISGAFGERKKKKITI